MTMLRIRVSKDLYSVPMIHYHLLTQKKARDQLFSLRQLSNRPQQAPTLPTPKWLLLIPLKMRRRLTSSWSALKPALIIQPSPSYRLRSVTYSSLDKCSSNSQTKLPQQKSMKPVKRSSSQSVELFSANQAPSSTTLRQKRLTSISIRLIQTT